MKKYILASGSPRRKELLEQVGLEFEVITSNADEVITETNPSKIVRELSFIKAKAVAEEINLEKDMVVIAADTIVYNDGAILGKPENEEDAFNMIKAFAGKNHQVYTGVTVIGNGMILCFYESTDVHVYAMTDEEIRDYVATGEPMDKAGAYGIQGIFAKYVDKIVGDYNNVVGLPVARLMHEMKKAGLYD